MTHQGIHSRIEQTRIMKQSPWGVWWLSAATLGIYYVVWYDRVNGELASYTVNEREGWTRWWSQIIPFYGLIGLFRTVKRLNQAHRIANSSVAVSQVIACVWAPAWFGSHTRYLQRRINALADIQAAQ